MVEAASCRDFIIQIAMQPARHHEPFSRVVARPTADTPMFSLTPDLPEAEHLKPSILNGLINPTERIYHPPLL
jgi:hypothetical protein